MNTDIADIRKEYAKSTLGTTDINPDPVKQFEKWFQEAINSDVLEPNAMNLSTVSQGKPHARIVLLKGIEENEFIFYSNYNSEKGQNMQENQHVALTFFWAELERQVRVEGIATKIDPARSDAYFNSRPRGSKIGAWVSPQSQIISNREYLNTLQSEMEERFENQEVERPPHWGGYAVKPSLIEFWQGRPSRLHDRLQYSLSAGNDWKIDRLAP